MRFEMACQLVERVIHQGVVGDTWRSGRETREPRRTLTVVGKQAMDVGPDDTAVGRDGAFRRAVGKPREGTRAVGSLGHANMHFIARKRGAIEACALYLLQPLPRRERGL